jgi:hypothetical protein
MRRRPGSVALNALRPSSTNERIAKAPAQVRRLCVPHSTWMLRGGAAIASACGGHPRKQRALPRAARAALASRGGQSSPIHHPTPRNLSGSSSRSSSRSTRPHTPLSRTSSSCSSLRSRRPFTAVHAQQQQDQQQQPGPAPSYPYNAGPGERMQKATIEHIFTAAGAAGADAGDGASTSGSSGSGSDSPGRPQAPWSVGWQMSERNMVWNDDLKMRLIRVRAGWMHAAVCEQFSGCNAAGILL